MRVNNVVAKMNAGQKAYGCSLTFPSTALVELIGMAGLDHVSFDSEHGPFTPESLDDLCRVADMAGITPMARVPNIDSSTILRFLDRGIMGITGPHITNPGPGAAVGRCLPLRAPAASAASAPDAARTSENSSLASSTWSTHQFPDTGYGPA